MSSEKKSTTTLNDIKVMFHHFLTFTFGRGRQHPEDPHGCVTFVYALVFDFLNVRKWVQRTAKVSLPCLGITSLAFRVFSCRRHDCVLHFSSKKLFVCCFFFIQFMCPFTLAHQCGWPNFWTDTRLCPSPSHAGLHVSRELRTLPSPEMQRRNAELQEEEWMHIN